MATQREQIEADLARTIKNLLLMDAAIEGPAGQGVLMIKFDSGTGEAMQRFVSPVELIQLITGLELKRDRLQRILNGQAVMTSAIRP